MPSRLPGVGLAMVTICKWTLRITADGRLEPHEEPMLPSGDVCGDSPVYPNDFVPYKPRADVIVHAHAHSPGGVSVRYLPVAIAVGPVRKHLLVAGDREWKRGLLGSSAGDPTPFPSMPLGWNRAFGGVKDAANPIGRGRDGKLLPNLEWPDRLVQSPNDRIPPAGFGATAADWEPRRSMIGTYGRDYVAKHWPWLPPDFDFAHYNAAPRDQQVEGHLRGDESLTFTNLHRSHPELTLTLPDSKAKLFATFAGGEFRDVPLLLDTLFCDLENDRVVLIWRGHTPVGNPMFHEVEHLLAALEPLDSPRSIEHYRAMRDTKPAAAAVPTEDPAAAQVAAAADVAMEAKAAAMEAELAQADAEMAAAAAEQERALLEQGIDQAVIRPPTQQEGLQAQRAELARLTQTPPPEILQAKPVAAEPAMTPEEAAEIEELEAEFEAEKASMRKPPAWTRERLLEAVAAGTELQDEDLSGLDLSGCALAGARLDGVVFAGCNFQRADLHGTSFRGAVLQGADLAHADLSGAILDGADCTGASFAGARLAGSSLARTNLEKQNLVGLDLSGCRGESVRFAGADLRQCKLNGAAFPKGDFAGSKLAGADCTGLDLQNARLHTADAKGANFQRAILRGMRGDDGCNLADADFRHANLEGVVIEFGNLHGADLRYASVRNALLTGTDLGQSDLSRADFERASLADANLTGARLLQTNLRYASLERCEMKGADARQANFYGAGLWETKTELCDLREAILASTLLALR
ncbi:MAG: DUF2169 domain-containing protein [Planctomycetes bacterium]|nr:DUF2169 domain-containing protein [Planctomycetota bacterium]